MRSWWAALLLVGCVGDHDPPELIDFNPPDGTDLSGVGGMSAWAVYRDDNLVTTRMFVDGEFVGDAETQCRDHTCQALVTFSTLAFAPGIHDLSVSLEDEAGNVTSETHQILFDDVLTVTSMRVANIVDESGTLEIEVYAFDEQDQMIGCAGSRHGLQIVDNSGVEYQTDAILVTPEAVPRPFSTGVAGDKKFRLEVWEDDDEPVCPAQLDPLGNDLVGKSPLMTAAEWRAMPTINFGDVTKLGTAWTRDLPSDWSDPPPLDTTSNGSISGCQATTSSSTTSATLVVLALAFGGRRRRRRAAQ